MNLAPHISVEYWRNTAIGIVPAHRSTHPDFAILWVSARIGRDGQRFELPDQADQLSMVLRAIEAAYALGHHDRRNRFRKTLGLDPIDVVLPCDRMSDDA